jgi:hypothetical protein
MQNIIRSLARNQQLKQAVMGRQAFVSSQQFGFGK